MKDKIKNIIFDLGGVLFDIDYTLTVNAFKKIGVNNFDEIFSKKKQSNLFDRFEEGKVSADEFTSELSRISNAKLTTPQVEFALNSMLFSFPKYRFELLNNLRKNYRLFLYSNINEIHAKEVLLRIQQVNQGTLLDSYFEKIYFSNILGIRKPKPEGFQFIVDQHQLAPQETLFIDDSPQHVEGAKKINLQAVWLDLEKKNIHDLVNELGLKKN